MLQDAIVAALLLGGVSFVLLAALGALRFPDVLTRMAAVSKASTLGLTLIFIAVIIHSRAWGETLKAFITIAMLWLSVPIATHLLGRASILTNEKLSPNTKGIELIDEIKSENGELKPSLDRS